MKWFRRCVSLTPIIVLSLLVSAVAVLSFTLGGLVSMKRSVDQDARIDQLRADMALMTRGVAGTSGVLDADATAARATASARAWRAAPTPTWRNPPTATS